MGRGQFPNLEISLGIIAKFWLCSVLAAESHSTISLLIPLAPGLGKKQVDPGNVGMRVFFTELVEITVEFLVPVCQICIQRPACLLHSELHIQTFIIYSCTDAREGEHSALVFSSLFYYTFTEMCSFILWGSYCELCLYKLIDTWHSIRFLDCAVDQSWLEC